MATEKLSTSRWREAVRSGEVSPEAGERVMRSLGITPEEWARRVGAGAEKMITHHGYTHLHKGDPGVLRNLLFEGPSRLRRALAFARGSRSGSIGSTSPVAKLVFTSPATEYAVQGRIPPGLHEWVLHHEAREVPGLKIHKRRILDTITRAAEAKGPFTYRPTAYYRISPELAESLKPQVGAIRSFAEGLGVHPANINAYTNLGRVLLGEGALPIAGVYDSAHVSPRLPIEDIRESRLMPRAVRDIVHNMRTESGELADIAHARGVPTSESLKLPRHEINRLARRIQETQASRIADLVDAPASPGARRLGETLRKLLRMR